jgi:hypothetical protein
MYSSRLRWAIVNEDRHCGARRRRARIPWSIEVLGPARPVGQPMVPHVQHAGRCGNLRGICGTLRDHCWNMLEFAGLCGTMLDHAGPFAGHAGHDWPIAHDRPLHDSKKWAPSCGNWGATPTVTASSWCCWECCR